MDERDHLKIRYSLARTLTPRRRAVGGPPEGDIGTRAPHSRLSGLLIFELLLYSSAAGGLDLCSAGLPPSRNGEAGLSSIGDKEKAARGQSGRLFIVRYINRKGILDAETLNGFQSMSFLNGPFPPKCDIIAAEPSPLPAIGY